MTNKSYTHPSAFIDEQAKIGKNVKIWHLVQVRECVEIGKNSIIGKNVYLDYEVKIGQNCKIQNNVSIYHPAVIEDGVFIGPHVCFTNDKFPRAINPDGSLQSSSDWQTEPVIIKTGASIGANTTILSGVTIGSWAMVGAGSVVTKDVPDFALVYGHPARVKGRVDKTGKRVSNEES